ncbi:MAG: type II secretion system F family protein [Acidobacteriota bacterium]
MPEFQCKVVNVSGEILERSYSYDSEASLRKDLEKKDYLILSVKKRNPFIEMLKSFFVLRRRIKIKEFLFFNQELAALIKAGLPIITGLDILIERRRNQTFKKALIDIRNRVKSGSALSEAFDAQGDLFPKIYSSSLASGERSGEISTVLKRYISYTKILIALRKRVISAMIYPAVIFSLSIGLIFLLIYYILPKFNEFYASFEADLPLITRTLILLALFVREWIFLGVAIIVIGIFSINIWNRTSAGRLRLDALKLKIPLIGNIIHHYAISRFARTLSTLVAGGIPLVTSLEIAGNAIGNSLFTREIMSVARKVKEGEAMWESLEKTGLMSDMAIEMIKVGESTGSLEEMLGNVSDFTDEEIEQKVNTLLSLLEPMLLIFMAFVVGGMLLAIYLPLLKVYGRSQF